MTTLRKRLEETYDELMFADGLDDAIVGVVQRCGFQPVVCYDTKLCLEILARDMSYDDASEYFEFNVIGAYMGPLTPMWLESPHADDL